MNARTTARTAWRTAAAAAALTIIATGCGTEVQPTPSDIGGVVDTQVAVPSNDSANCAVSATEAHAERRPVCAD